MAPAKKVRSVNKRYANKDSPVKDVISSGKSNQKKKLSDKLGPQWSKGELQCFYEAYRNYGQEWKKVAAQVHNRSAEMVESLYNMNRAYLSLLEGTTSVVGLIAMMTDHYHVLEGSDSERESNDASGMPRKIQKHKQAKVQLGVSKEDLTGTWSMAATGGCLSLLKSAHTNGSQPRAVKKRTPRYPVSYSHNKDDFIHLNKKGWRSDADANDDEVVHVAALALTEASQRGGSPQISHSSYERTEHEKSLPVHSWDKMLPKAEMASLNVHNDVPKEGSAEVRILKRRPENGTYSRGSKSLMDMEGVGTVEVHRKGKRFYRKKMKVKVARSSPSDDEGEACSGTEGLSSRTGTADSDVFNAKNEEVPPRFQTKRSKKKPFFGDGSPAFNALQTLADLSLMLPDSSTESESSVQLKEERSAFDMDEKSSVHEATSTSHPKHKIKDSGPKEKTLKTITEVGRTNPRKPKIGSNTSNDFETIAEVNELHAPPNSKRKRKRENVPSKKASDVEALMDIHTTRTLEVEALAEKENKFSRKGKHTIQLLDQLRQWKPGRVLEGSPVNDQSRARIDLVASTIQVPIPSPASLPPTKWKSKCKTVPKRKLSTNEVKTSEKSLENQPNENNTSHQTVEEELSCCLSSDMVRRWCIFEWFYSAIDYPWFFSKEFVEYLNHVGLGHVPRLTRAEWGVIRSSLGNPRRLSECFVHDEREKLKQYRESVRKHYFELRDGARDGLPRDLPRPLSVGQRVIAIHPKTRELHDGSVLTVGHDKCRIQFDRPELGVEFVVDIDCMPSNPLDNLPEALRRLSSADKFSAIFEEPQVRAHPYYGYPMFVASDRNLEKASLPLNTLPKLEKRDMNYALSQAQLVAAEILGAQQAAYGHVGQPCKVLQIPRETTRHAFLEEVLLMELRNANNDVLERKNDREGLIKDSDPLKKHIATASSAVLQVRQHNIHTDGTRPPWPNPAANAKMLGNSYSTQESVSAVVEIVNGSRVKAHTMVDAAMKAMSSMKEGEDAFTKIGEALDHIDKRKLPSDPKVSIEQVNGSLSHCNQFVSGTSDLQAASHASNTKLQVGSNEAQIPYKLIISCVATLLMIQTCTERHTPAEVAQIIDSAVSSLDPCYSQNLPIYREIEMSMRRIKTQILALIPTSI